MKYLAPDGNLVESKPYPQEVIYSCSCDGISDGIYHSIETFSSADNIGIKQIKIKRVVIDNKMTISIVRSSEEELLQYLTQINKA